jgi:hypothetical protein
VLPLLAAGAASDDCFDNCFKRCIGKDKSMTDYCNYACGMTCGGGPVVDGALRTMNCQLACVRDSCQRLRSSSSGNRYRAMRPHTFSTKAVMPSAMVRRSCGGNITVTR